LDPACRIDDDQALAANYWRQARMPFNVTGQPGLVIPAGFSKDGLPLSLQLVGRPFTEPMLYRVAQFYEDATGWTKRHPAGLTDRGSDGPCCGRRRGGATARGRVFLMVSGTQPQDRRDHQGAACAREPVRWRVRPDAAAYAVEGGHRSRRGGARGPRRSDRDGRWRLGDGRRQAVQALSGCGSHCAATFRG
jgi:amidase